jgi:hypothetical protein
VPINCVIVFELAKSPKNLEVHFMHMTSEFPTYETTNYDSESITVRNRTLTVATKELVVDLKSAACVSIYRDAKGNTELVCYFEETIRGNVVKHERKWLITSSLTCYDDCEGRVCYADADYLQSSYTDTSAKTAIESIKVGDEFRFHFTASNNNGWLKKAELHLDECHLYVTTPSKSGKNSKRKRFLIVHRVCPDHSGRMVTKHGRNIDPRDSAYINRHDTVYSD